MSARISVILLVIAGGAVVEAGQQSREARRPTLVEQAREHGGIERVGMACGWQDGPPTLERLVATADVVVHGTIVEVIGILSADQQDVWTHYTVNPMTVVRDRTPRRRVIGSSRLPIFRSRGGTVFVEGLKITVAETMNGSRVRLDVGDEVILFGRSKHDHFEFEPFEVFIVKAGTVTPNGRWPQLNRDGRPVDLVSFLSRVASNW
jgi:hypothetical protein